MSETSTPYQQEPILNVGIIDRTESVTIRLNGTYRLNNGEIIGPGELRVQCLEGLLRCTGVVNLEARSLEFHPDHADACQFILEATIGIDFHWQQTETQAFRGSLLLVANREQHLTVINRIALETYITSVISSEMNADSPVEATKTHAIISRSWLLAQLEKKGSGLFCAKHPKGRSGKRVLTPFSQHIRWTEREAHGAYDVCSDDHCQRYQGVGRTDSPEVAAAIAQTRGQLLLFAGRACDARFSKCCGGVTEEYQTAWGDETVPYLVALPDAPGSNRSLPLLTNDSSLRAFLQDPSDAFCNCHDASILQQVLNDYDQKTADFFRWQVKLKAAQAGQLVQKKLGIDLGRLVAMETLERGPSGRLKRLRLVGETSSLVVGKELEIRRALSPTHLYSSAFVVDTEGPANRPEAFILKGAGWGHGVGLCQIGAAVMACQGIQAEDILQHYYPGTELVRCYG
ncbi:MAG: SpoIID/LytB domain-containing protein [Pirellulales bacterium]